METKQPTKEQLREFCLTVEAWDEAGIPYGLSDMENLALELGTPIPHFDKSFNLVWD